MPLLRRLASFGLTAFILIAGAYILLLPALGPAVDARDFTGIIGNAERGAYMARGAGCFGCHTDAAAEGAPFAGGGALKSEFGTFYGPNITPDPTHGIGGWSLADFSRALADGVSPAGEHYFPAFPFTSYTKMSSQDVADLKAYLDALPPVGRANRQHDLSWPFSDRRFLGLWKLISFEPGPFSSDSTRSASWNRGAYLVQGPGHCAECHTERNLIGGLSGPPLAGNRRGLGGVKVPGIDALFDHSGQAWTREDLILSLQTGLMPDGDTFDGTMGAVVEQGTSYLTDEDISAMADYLFFRENQQ